MRQTIKKIIAICLSIWSVTFLCPFALYAQETESETESNRPKIMVSLGDSYSSGEGIEPFYGQDKAIADKVIDEDWLAHRSQKSWSGLLELPGNDGTMADNKDQYWFFEATSGAVTDNLINPFTKEYNKDGISGQYELSPQLDVFDNIKEPVDYVTITIGGNDAEFTNIITQCVLQGLFFQNKNTLDSKLDNIWNKFYADDGIKDHLLDSYKSIEQEAGLQANIIVVGYPQLLSKEQSDVIGLCFSKEEVDTVNFNVSKFNEAIEEIVNSCRQDGMNIYFVSVEDVFDGHEAYSKDPYINSIIVLPQEQDLIDDKKPSAYSLHPNEEGVKAYAACVQTKIDEIERGDVLDSLKDTVAEQIDNQEQELVNAVNSKLMDLWDRLKRLLEEWLNRILMEIENEA